MCYWYHTKVLDTQKYLIYYFSHETASDLVLANGSKNASIKSTKTGKKKTSNNSVS